jgi:ankyrin repeat protein
MQSQRTRLHQAAIDGDTTLINRLLEDNNERRNILSRDQNAWTPLHWAVWKRSKTAIDALISNGAPIGARDSIDETPLQKAKKWGGEELVNYMMSLHERYCEKQLELEQAVTAKNWELLPKLVEMGAKMNGRLENGSTVFLKTLETSNAETIDVLVRLGVDIDSNMTDDGEAGLHVAARLGMSNIVEKLIDLGIKLEATDKLGLTPLHTAVLQGSGEIVEILLDRGADIEAKDSKGQTPLHIAVSRRLEEIIEILLDRGADIEAKDNEGQTPLHVAVSQGSREIVEILLSRGVDIEAKDNKGQTPLHVTVSRGSREFIEILLDRGADIEAEDSKGQTPLHVAMSQELREIVEILLDRGADIEAEDHKEQTPLYIAVSRGSREFIEILLDRGAETAAKDSKGQSNARPNHCS